MASESYDSQTLRGLGEKLQNLLRLRTLPIAMKRFRTVEEARAVPKVRWPQDGVPFTSCQLVSRARYYGITLGFAQNNVRPNSNCGGILGLNVPAREILDGQEMAGVWFENQAAAKAHQENMPRAQAGRYSAIVVSPLRSARLSDPEILLFYGSPAQIILCVNGLQWKEYQRFDMSITGESACADSWGKALLTGKTSISIPCFAERRYGGVVDDEMLMAMPPADLYKAVEGLQGLSEAGLRYPITPYSIDIDPSSGLSISYPSQAKPK